MKTWGKILLGVLLLCSAAAPVYAETVPAVTAEAAVVMDMDTGQVLYGKAEHERRPPASLTKVMTGYLAAKQPNLQQTVTGIGRGCRHRGIIVGFKRRRPACLC